MLINAHIYNPANALFKQPKREPAQLQTVWCDKTKECDLFKAGQCRRLNCLCASCTYGKYSVEHGPSRLSNKFSGWINKNKEQYKDILDKLKAPTIKMAKIGDYILLDYAHVDMEQIGLPFVSNSAFFISGVPFLPVSAWTVENITKIIKARPYALMGGEITSYQKEVVPLFLQDLVGFDYEMYKKVLAANPDLKPITNQDYIGRTAYLSTIKDNSEVIIDDRKWLWNTEANTLTLIDENNTNKSLQFMTLYGGKYNTLIVEPPKDAKVKITDVNQLTEKTVFC